MITTIMTTMVCFRRLSLSATLPLLLHTIALLLDKSVGFTVFRWREINACGSCRAFRRPSQSRTTIHSPTTTTASSNYVWAMSSSEQSDNERLTDRKFAQRTNLWVIIVDDEESIRLAVGDYLYDQGYQVTACADADALIEVCAQSLEPDQLPVVPDAIISDIRMPGKDGIELLKMIRADDRLKQVPVILLTAKGLTSDRILGFKAGADAYLPKPFNPDELLSILDNAILRRRQMQGDKKVITDIKQDLAGIKMIMKQNSQDVVKQTDVYLTPVEREVLNLLCKGYTNAEIAAERGISLNVTVQQIKRLYQITNTDTRTALVRWAFKTGYISKR